MIEKSRVKLLSDVLNTIKLKDFSVNELERLLNLKRFLKSTGEKTDDLFIALMEKYEVPKEAGGVFNYNKHPQLLELENEISNINKDLVNIDEELPEEKKFTKFLTLDQIKKALKDEHTLEHLNILCEFLRKD